MNLYKKFSKMSVKVNELAPCFVWLSVNCLSAGIHVKPCNSLNNNICLKTARLIFILCLSAIPVEWTFQYNNYYQ